MNNSQSSHEKTCVGIFLIKLQALRTATLLKRDSSETCKIFKNTLFCWTSPVAAFDSFRFLASVNFKKFLRTSSGRTPPDYWSLSLTVNFVFLNILVIEHLWETAYLMFKLQYFNQEIESKTTSYVLFKHFIQEREAAIRRRSFT